MTALDGLKSNDSLRESKSSKTRNLESKITRTIVAKFKETNLILKNNNEISVIDREQIHIKRTKNKNKKYIEY